MQLKLTLVYCCCMLEGIIISILTKCTKILFYNYKNINYSNKSKFKCFSVLV